MSAYDPLPRGPHPVGVRTEVWTDTEHNISYPVEIYYPADQSLAGRDLIEAEQDSFENLWEPGVWQRQAALRDAEAAGGTFPYIINMHGWAGFRVEFTYLSTHLASHGYLVVSPDVPGSTTGDVADFFARPEIVGKPEHLHDHVKSIRETRYLAVPFLVQQGLDSLPVADEIVGFTGPSFGGWTALIAPRLDPRIRAVVPQCPAGGNMYVHGTLQELGDISHARPTMMLVGSRDCLTPVLGQFDIYQQLTPGTRQMVVLVGGDHVHFGDDIAASHEWLRGFLANVAAVWPNSDWDIPARLIRPFEEMAPAAPTNDLWRMLALAHFDAHLKGNLSARAFSEPHGLTERLESRTGLKLVTVGD